MKKHAMEVQKVQLEQMKQNELRKETERETDKFYAALTMKNQQAQVSRHLRTGLPHIQIASEGFSPLLFGADLPHVALGRSET